MSFIDLPGIIKSACDTYPNIDWDVAAKRVREIDMIGAPPPLVLLRDQFLDECRRKNADQITLDRLSNSSLWTMYNLREFLMMNKQLLDQVQYLQAELHALKRRFDDYTSQAWGNHIFSQEYDDDEDDRSSIASCESPQVLSRQVSSGASAPPPEPIKIEPKPLPQSLTMTQLTLAEEKLREQVNKASLAAVTRLAGHGGQVRLPTIAETTAHAKKGEAHCASLCTRIREVRNAQELQKLLVVA